MNDLTNLTDAEALLIVHKLEARSPTILSEDQRFSKAIKNMALSEEDLLKLISKSHTKGED